MTRSTAIEKATHYFEAGQFVQNLAELISHQTESQNPTKVAELQRYLMEAIVPHFQDLGFTCEIHSNPIESAGPILVAERIEDETLPTILSYGHGDVIMAQTDEWRDGLHPFRLVEEGDRLYGRGTADNKGQHLINIMALKSVLEVRGALGFNCRTIIEMGEEIGSLGLKEFCATHKDALAADVFIASDGPRLQSVMPTMFMGARGCLSFDLVVSLRESAHHSGNWGGVLADPAIILAHALSTITDTRGQIQIAEWCPNSLTDDIREALRDLPIDDETGPAVDVNWGEENLTVAERMFGWNSFTILAMHSGMPQAPVNAISASAMAVCQLRFVVGTNQADILPALRRHLDTNGFEGVKIIPHDRGFFDATRLQPNHPWVKFVARSLQETSGKVPHVLPNLAGSLPNEVFANTLNLPTIWIPHSYRACSQHAPNEHLLCPVAQDALRIMAGLFWDIGAGKAPQ